MTTTLQSLLDEYRDTARSKRDMGDQFEHLVAAYLRTEPYWKDRFAKVWLWTEWPERGKKPDTGIDLVAEEAAGGGLCAIQCKFYAPDHTLQKSDVDSFFSASARAPFMSRLVVSTTDRWSKHAEDLLQDERIPCVRLRLQDLKDSAVDWSAFRWTRPDQMSLRKKKQARPHQTSALRDVTAGLAVADRGKLIMACGTGKTLTALKLAERFAVGGTATKGWKKKEDNGHVLFLVPSIALLGQSLSEWVAEAEVPMHALAVCSDTAVGKKSAKKADDTEDLRLHDLPFPATTKAAALGKHLELLTRRPKPLTVIFSTYQSLGTIHEAQKRHGLPPFALVICDEAHRTTGVTLAGTDESAFVKVHDEEYIHAAKRLYMTATPRIYMDGAKQSAKAVEAELASMDDEKLYGRELHRLGFGDAIGQELLSDYKVLVLAVDERYVSRTFQKELAAVQKQGGKEYSDFFSDITKLTGCWNGLSKRMMAPDDLAALASDTQPMRRAVAFAKSIAASKQVADLFGQVVAKYTAEAPEAIRPTLLQVSTDHVDGTMNALQRAHRLDWLQDEMTEAESPQCRILSNARCLAEGVDVPALDAVLFLNPRNSVVDVVQAVGRVMRRAPGKQYGYIILPIGIPADTPPEEALKDNEKYKVVWQVLQALRSHDERIEAAINTIDLTGTTPAQIRVIGVSGPGWDEDSHKGPTPEGPAQFALAFPELEQWRDAIFAKLVLKVGDRRYWESWAKDVAEIAERQIVQIRTLLANPDPKVKARWHFTRFLTGLRKDLNPAVSETDAIEMLAQHAITQPVFDALFAQHSFTAQNPVSKDLNRVLATMRKHGLGQGEEGKLDRFYDSVRLRAAGITTPEGRQKVVVELYDKFFRTAFPRMADRLGIVYTPLEIVDFIIQSVDDVLEREFGERLTSKGVQILDPFTGTGTFVVRLLQSGRIRPEDLVRKYQKELHANELVLLAYYIAAVNIEAAYHDLRATAGAPEDYEAFPGIVLTDTFQMAEGDETFVDELFAENDARVARQKQSDIRVIMGNPPYSVGQGDANTMNQNVGYPALNERIAKTYAAKSSATNKNSLYDSYIKALRWASDRLKDRGVVCFVTNGSFIDGAATAGLRQSLVEEFSQVYVLNLRGNQRTAGEQSHQEGGKVFGGGSRTPVAITVLVKNPDRPSDGKVRYHDIGDYLSREEKLAALTEFGSAAGVPWQAVTPDPHGDWINTRDPAYERFMPIGEKQNDHEVRVFESYSNGLKTGRDAWAYNFSSRRLAENMGRMIDFYTEQREVYGKALRRAKGSPPTVEQVVDKDPTKISWNRGLLADLGRQKQLAFDGACVVESLYRPFTREHVYFQRALNDMVYKVPTLFPRPGVKNVAIGLPAPGARGHFSTLMTDRIPALHAADMSGSQFFPLYYYEEVDQDDLLSEVSEGGLVRRDAITDAALRAFRSAYADQSGGTIGKEDLFYYVYGILHSSEYRQRFASDLKKDLPRIPLAGDFWAFSEAGRRLATLHVDYEAIEPYPLTETGELALGSRETYRVQKMSWAKRRVGGKLVADKTTLVYNARLTLTNIPPEALEYVVSGKPAVEWVMERYQVTTDPDSKITNDPNDWAAEHQDPQYILNLVKRVVRVSVETVKIVRTLPPLQEQ